jgi:citrate lyase gamma subunit
MLKKITLLVFILAAMVGASILSPDLKVQVGQIPPATELSVKARDLKLACPGSLYKAGGASGTTLGNFAHVGTANFASQFNSNAGATLESADGIFKVAAPGENLEQGSALLNASQYQNASGATLKGLAATNCQLPSNDLWLLGGDTTTGREALLILRNPSEVDATVSLEIFTEAGSIDAPGLSGIAVVAGKSTVIPLSGIVPKTKSFMTHVVSKGGAIAAWVQQRTVRGLSAGGVDYVSPSPSFSKSQVVPGIFIRGAKLANKLAAANADYKDLAPVIRVFVPGKEQATVTIQVAGSNAKTFGTVIRETVKPQTVMDLEITGLKDGDYVAVVTSDVEIQSAVRLTRLTASSAPDFTWIPAAEKFTGKRKITAPSIGISKICVYNDKTGAIEVGVIAPGATYSFMGSADPLYANLIVDVDGTVASLSVLDQKNAGGKVSVNVR